MHVHVFMCMYNKSHNGIIVCIFFFFQRQQNLSHVLKITKFDVACVNCSTCTCIYTVKQEVRVLFLVVLLLLYVLLMYSV